LGSGIQQPDDDSHVDVDRSVENRDGFLGHHLTEDSSLSLRDIRSPFYTGRFKGKPDTTLVLKLLTKKPAKKKTLVCSFVERKMTVENQSERLEFMPKNLDYKCH
jgi:hypothetical protein